MADDVTKVELASAAAPTAPPVMLSHYHVQLALIGLLGTFLAGLLTLATQWIAIHGQNRARVAAEDVRDTLETKTIASDEKLDVIHDLVNSDMGQEKLRVARALQRVAELTKDVADIEAAKAAIIDYNDHQKRQKLELQNRVDPAKP